MPPWNFKSQRKSKLEKNRCECLKVSNVWQFLDLCYSLESRIATAKFLQQIAIYPCVCFNRETPKTVFVLWQLLVFPCSCLLIFCSKGVSTTMTKYTYCRKQHRGLFHRFMESFLLQFFLTSILPCFFRAIVHYNLYDQRYTLQW